MEQVHLLANDSDYEAGAMAEPLACCLHGMDIVNIKAGDRVVVIGGGAIGLLMVQLAKLSGASKVLLSEPVEIRREIGMKVGADAAVNPLHGDLKNQINNSVGSGAIDVVIECVGKNIAVEQAIKIADRGSKILLFSVPSPDAKIELPLFDVFVKELKIFGSFVNPNTQSRATELINSGRLDLKSIITHRFNINEVDKAIEKQMEQDSIKVIVKP